MKTISFVKPIKQVFEETSPLETADFVCTNCGTQGMSPSSATPVQEGYQNPLSLDALFIHHPASTFFVKVGEGGSHASVSENKYLGVSAGDVLTVDRTITPTLGRLVLAVSEGSFTLCRFTEHEGRQFLVCGDEKNTAQELQTEEDVYVWGVVSALSRSV